MRPATDIEAARALLCDQLRRQCRWPERDPPLSLSALTATIEALGWVLGGGESLAAALERMKTGTKGKGG